MNWRIFTLAVACTVALCSACGVEQDPMDPDCGCPEGAPEVSIYLTVVGQQTHVRQCELAEQQAFDPGIHEIPACGGENICLRLTSRGADMIEAIASGNDYRILVEFAPEGSVLGPSSLTFPPAGGDAVVILP